MLGFIGRLLVAGSLLFSAYSLFTHNETMSKFTTALPTVLKHLPFIPQNIAKTIAESSDYLRQGTAGLLGLASLLIFKPNRFITFLVIIGVALRTFVLENPLVGGDAARSGFIQSLGTIGSLIYMMGTAGIKKVVSEVPKMFDKKNN